MFNGNCEIYKELAKKNIYPGRLALADQDLIDYRCFDP